VSGSYVQQVIDQVSTGTKFEEAISKLAAEIDTRKKDCLKEIEREKEEDAKKLTSDNMYHEVYNTKVYQSYFNTILQSAPNPGSKSSKVIETIHSPSGASKGKEGEEQLHPAAEADSIASPVSQAFAEVKTLEDSYKFLSSHPGIVNQKESDEILAEAFRLQMKGGASAKKTKQYIHQSLLLQYCSLLGKDGVMLFFKRWVFDLMF
jgi:cell division cycle protein 37